MKKLMLSLIGLIISSSVFGAELWQNNGLFGIGTQSPKYELDIVGGQSDQAYRGLNISGPNARLYLQGKRAMEGGDNLWIGEGYPRSILYKSAYITGTTPALTLLTGKTHYNWRFTAQDNMGGFELQRSDGPNNELSTGYRTYFSIHPDGESTHNAYMVAQSDLSTEYGHVFRSIPTGDKPLGYTKGVAAAYTLNDGVQVGKSGTNKYIQALFGGMDIRGTVYGNAYGVYGNAYVRDGVVHGNSVSIYGQGAIGSGAEVNGDLIGVYGDIYKSGGKVSGRRYAGYFNGDTRVTNQLQVDEQVVLDNRILNVLSFTHNGNVNRGIKIKTNIPYINSKLMPTIFFKGYNYGSSKPINFALSFYIYQNKFIRVGGANAGGYIPEEVTLGIENNKVVIFLKDETYFPRFSIEAEMGGLGAHSSYFKGWTAKVDESLTSSVKQTVPFDSTEKLSMYNSGSYHEDTLASFTVDLTTSVSNKNNNAVRAVMTAGNDNDDNNSLFYAKYTGYSSDNNNKLFHGEMTNNGSINYGLYLKGETRNYLSGAVGIGTQTPQTNFHVYAPITSAHKRRVAMFNVARPGQGHTFLGIYGDSSSNNWIGTEGDENLHLGSGDFPESITIRGVSGKVGIGTKNPDRLLTVSSGKDRLAGLHLDSSNYSGNDGAYSFLTLSSPTYKNGSSSTATEGFEIGLENKTGLVYFSRHQNSGSGGGDKKWVMNKLGYLGIGTIDPKEKIHIANGDIMVDSGRGLRGPSGTEQIRFHKTNGLMLNAGGELVSQFTKELAEIKTPLSSSKLLTPRVDHQGESGTNLLLINEKAGGIDYLADDKGHNFKTYNESWKTRMNIVDNGRVGVGNSAPDAQFHVRRSGDSKSSTTAIFDSNNFTAVRIRSTEDNKGLNLITYGDSYQSGTYLSLGKNSAHIAADAQKGLGILTTSTEAPIVFGIGNKEKMRIAASGKVGIGTKTPTEKSILDINGRTMFRDGLDIGGPGSDGYGKIGKITWSSKGYLSLVAQKGYGLALGSEGNQEQVYINRSGNLGVGELSPVRRLTVNSGESSDIARFGNKSGYFELGHTAGRATIDLGQDKRFRIRQYDTSNFFINTDGTVAIGAGEKTNPNYALTVGGRIIAKGFTHKTDIWADYVFEPEYHLMSLENLEHFVKTNKHLPGVPDQETVLENGADVGDVQVKLLEKIEELTLHVIALNKRVKALEAEAGK